MEAAPESLPPLRLAPVLAGALVYPALIVG